MHYRPLPSMPRCAAKKFVLFAPVLALACSHVPASPRNDPGAMVLGASPQTVEVSIPIEPDHEASVVIVVSYRRSAEPLPFDLEISDCAGHALSGSGDATCQDRPSRDGFDCVLRRELELDESEPSQPVRISLKSATDRSVVVRLNLQIAPKGAEKIHVRSGPAIAPK